MRIIGTREGASCRRDAETRCRARDVGAVAVLIHRVGVGPRYIVRVVQQVIRVADEVVTSDDLGCGKGNIAEHGAIILRVESRCACAAEVRVQVINARIYDADAHRAAGVSGRQRSPDLRRVDEGDTRGVTQVRGGQGKYLLNPFYLTQRCCVCFVQADGDRVQDTLDVEKFLHLWMHRLPGTQGIVLFFPVNFYLRLRTFCGGGLVGRLQRVDVNTRGGWT